MSRIARGSELAVLAVAFILVGLLVLWVAHGPARVADGLPGLVAAWALAASGLLALGIAPWSRIGPLLVVAALAWFIPDLATCLNVEPLSHRCLRLDGVAGIASVLGWAWLGIVASAVLTFPAGHADTFSRQIGVVVATVLVVALHAWPEPARAVAVALLVAGPLWLMTRSGDEGSERLAPPLAGTTLAVGLALPVGPSYGLDAAVVVASLLLLAGVTAVARRRASLTADRAVELGAALAGVLGDPGFRLVVRAPGADAWLDAGGRAVAQPSEPMGMGSTKIERDGQVVAVITHDPATLSNPEIRAAVEKAVELEAHNIRLRADLDGQLREMAASRRRLVDAGLREREALGQQVEADVLARLERLLREVHAAAEDGLPDNRQARLGQAEAQVEVARAEIQDLARGLYPATLASGGLAGALADLTRRSPVPVLLDVAVGPTVGSDVDATIYFVCAEALANAARHSHASSVRVEVRSSGDTVTATVEDDGIGGADPDQGSGLRGLRDRVEAVGGVLVVESVPGTGTRSAATIPVNREARGPT